MLFKQKLTVLFMIPSNADLISSKDLSQILIIGHLKTITTLFELFSETKL